MSVKINANLTGTLLGDLYGAWFDSLPDIVRSTASLRAEIEKLEQKIQEKSNALETLQAIKISDYVTHVDNSSPWLKAVEARIRASVLPKGQDISGSGEWLSVDSANAAINFFRLSADLLPKEPHIYPSLKGDLVAEFESEPYNLTAVVSGNETLLFAVLSNYPDEPIFEKVKRGSNHFREDVSEFTSKLPLGFDEQVESK